MYAQPSVLEGFVQREREFIRFYLLFALLLIATGVIIIVLGTVLLSSTMPDLFKTLLGLGGGLVATLSSFPTKEVLNRRDRISVITLLEKRLAMAQSGSPDDAALRQQIDDIFRKMVEKTSGGVILMADTHPDLQGLMQRIEKRERATRLRTVLFSLIPAALGLALIAYAWGQIAAARTQVVSLKGQVQTLQKQRDSLTLELQRSSTIAQFQCPYNLQAESKAFLGTVGPAQAGVWDDIFRLMNRQPAWTLGGTSPETGFNGPGFVAYILTQNKLVPGTPAEASDRLQELLRPEADPRPGDVVFYDQGYAMFYFVPPNSRQPCVVGMTPVGVVALTYHWRPILRFGLVPYH